MSKLINIAVVGLGQVGNYLLNELNTKKKDIELKTGKKINVVAVSARNINKKRKFKVNKKIFYKNPLEIFKKNKIETIYNPGLSHENLLNEINKYELKPTNSQPKNITKKFDDMTRSNIEKTKKLKYTK